MDDRARVEIEGYLSSLDWQGLVDLHAFAYVLNATGVTAIEVAPLIASALVAKRNKSAPCS